MNIIIPLCGKGERFTKAGYTISKPLIKVYGKEIIRYALDSLNVNPTDDLYIVINQRTAIIRPLINKYYPSATIIQLDLETSGASETIANALPHIRDKTKSALLLDGDNFYTCNVLDIIRQNPTQNQVVCFETDEEVPRYSYVKLEEESNRIVEIAEKRIISRYANTGCYYFSSLNVLEQSTKAAIAHAAVSNDEPYISHAIANSMFDTTWYGTSIQKSAFISLGTPEQVQAYESHTYGFLFDLDGTLVNTDGIYYKVWNDILKVYNIQLNADIYDTYIYSNTDADVKQKLLKIAPVSVAELTSQKDRLFASYIDDITIINSACEFIGHLKGLGHKVAIVTNSNRITAEAIIKYMNIKPDILIIGSECRASKPSPDPYLAAADAFCMPPSKTIVFEDSKNGIMSAKGAGVRNVIGINSSQGNIAEDVDLLIDDYSTITLDTILSLHKKEINLTKFVYDSLKLKYDISHVIIDPMCLKGGFIADVLSVSFTLNGHYTQAVLKLMNTNDSTLNKMANSLQLYDRENYFYESIAHFVPVKTPKCFGLLRDDNFKAIGVILEDMRPTAVINKCLSSESIDQTLIIISNLAKLHATFWDKPLGAHFHRLQKHNDPVYQPSWKAFLSEKFDTFRQRWQILLTPHQLDTCRGIIDDFNNIQDRLSSGPLTLCHGDVKSPNIFYKGTEPYFIDWQYVAHGKGVQDLIFFIIESFSRERMLELYPIFTNYYYTKLVEFGVRNYTRIQFNADIKDAVCHFPFFVAIWFGTTPTADLIDVNFPYFFIQKLFSLYDELF